MVGRLESLSNGQASAFGVGKVAYDRNFGDGHYPEGYLIFGPNMKVNYPPYFMHGVSRLGAGQYLAIFNFYVDWRGDPSNQPIAILDCCCDKGSKVIAQRKVTPQDLQRLEHNNRRMIARRVKIEMPVHISHLTNHLETRIFWTGVGLIRFGNISFHRIIR